MAISPNVDFTAGQILQATQQNQFPRGIVSFTNSTSVIAVTTTEQVSITSTAFTAVANRYYKVTYYEPLVTMGGSAVGYVALAVRITNLAGAVQTQIDFEPVAATSDGQQGVLTSVLTFSAGSTTLVGTIRCNALSCSAYAAATYKRQIIVEDIGPA